eukprot:13314206-Alexandrium_andersonii.AAC.1
MHRQRDWTSGPRLANDRLLDICQRSRPSRKRRKAASTQRQKNMLRAHAASWLAPHAGRLGHALTWDISR